MRDYREKSEPKGLDESLWRGVSTESLEIREVCFEKSTVRVESAGGSVVSSLQ